MGRGPSRHTISSDALQYMMWRMKTQQFHFSMLRKLFSQFSNHSFFLGMSANLGALPTFCETIAIRGLIYRANYATMPCFKD